MFCPKCGTENPDTGKFCRSCGIDLSHLTGALSVASPPRELTGSSGRPISLEGAMTRIFTGIAFLIVAGVLGWTGAAGGRSWWFWMLIPAFGSLGTGIAQYMQIRKHEASHAPSAERDSAQLNASQARSLTMPASTPSRAESRYSTGDLMPPSVTDTTTRHLEIDKEGRTMTLPKDKA